MKQVSQVLEQRQQAVWGSKDGGNPVGGVDFRAIPVVNQPMVGVAAVALPLVSVAQLEKDWNGLSKQLKTGNVPYEQLKTYAASCAANKEAHAQLVQITAYINNILRLEEDAAYATNPQMKEVLAALAG
jgi:hypothetical protein